MSRSWGIRALIPPSPNPSRQGRGRLRSENGPDFEVRSRCRGFTLIELVVALAVIAILTAIGLPMGLRWKDDYRFSMVARSLSNAVFMARMRGIENRAVFTIIASQATNAAPFNAACPGMLFTTNVNHGLSQPNPVLANALVLPPPAPAPWLPNWSPVSNCQCVKNLAAPPPVTPGDMVMISGLNATISMNGGDFEVLTVPGPTQFTVQHAVAAVLGDTGGGNNQGTVRNVTAPGRLRIVPAVSTAVPDPLNDNQESFSGSSAYTIKEEAASIVFRYDTDKYAVIFWQGSPPAPPADPMGPLPAGAVTLDPAAAASNFAEIRFDNRGLPKSTLIGNALPNTAITTTTIRIAESDAGKVVYQPRTIQYVISPTGKVNTTAN